MRWWQRARPRVDRCATKPDTVQPCDTSVWLMDFDIHEGSAGRSAMSSSRAEVGSLSLSVVNASDARFSQPRKSANGFAGDGLSGKQHPLRRMFHLDDLRAEPKPPVRAGGQIHKLRGNLRRQTERVRRRRTMRGNRLRPRGRKALDNLFGSGRSRAKTRLDGPDIHASPKPHELLALLEPLEGLIDRRAASNVQEFLGADQSALRQCVGEAQNLLGNGGHGASLSEIYIDF
jgi:hypothetical protein